MLEAPNEEDYEGINSGSNNKGKASAFPIYVLLSILFFPTILIAWAYYNTLLLKYRQKPYVTGTITIILVICSLIFWKVSGAGELAGETFNNINNFSENWKNLIPSYIVINIITGSTIGFFVILLSLRQLKNNPHRLQDERSWAYNFRFNRSPIDIIRRKKIIEGLKNGEFVDPEKAPLGIDEEHDDAVSYRYYSEANKQTLITGTSGSGKAYSMETVVPTPKGFIKNKNLELGDEIYGPDGKTAKITAFSEVSEQEEYEITFNDGTVIDGISGDHRWNVWSALSRGNSKKEEGRVRKPRLSPEIVKTLEKELEKTEKDAYITISEMYDLCDKRTNNLIRKVAKQIGVSHEIDNYVEQHKPNNTVKTVRIHSVIYKDDFNKIIDYHLNHSQPHMRQRAIKIDEFFVKNNSNKIVIKDLAKFIGVDTHTFSRTLKKSKVNISREKFNTNIFVPEHDRIVFIGKVNAYPKKEFLRRMIEIGKCSVNDQRIINGFSSVETTENLMKNILTANNSHNYSIKTTNPVEYSSKDLKIDPYALGLWLGDGFSRGEKVVCCGIISDLKEYKKVLENKGLNGLNIREISSKNYSEPFGDLYLEEGNFNKEFNFYNLRQKTTAEGSKKHIPEIYKISSIEQRLELLRGLMDSDGTVSKEGYVSFTQKNELLTKDVKEIIESLGFMCFNREKEFSYDSSSGKTIDTFAHNLSFSPNVNVFNLPRKKKKLDNRLSNISKKRRSFVNDHRYIVDIKRTGRTIPMRCLSVDNESHEFLIGRSFVPTHNTITMLSLIKTDITNGVPTIIVDFKRSPEVASKVAKWAKDNNREFYHFVNGDPEDYDVPNSPGQATYDPFVSASATGKADMLLNMREWDTASAVYKANMQELTSILFKSLFVTKNRIRKEKLPAISEQTYNKIRRKRMKAGKPFSRAKENMIESLLKIDFTHGTIHEINSVLSGKASELNDDGSTKRGKFGASMVGNFDALKLACAGTETYDSVVSVIDNVAKRNGKLHGTFNELQGQIRTLLASEAGDWLKTDKDSRNINLYELTKEDEDNVILLSLNGDAEKDFAKYFGSLIMSDLNNVSAKRRNKGQKNQVNVYVDEFQTVPATAVTSLLEKSRESGIAMTLSCQSYEQISASSVQGEHYLRGILDTCSNFIIHNGATERSATLMSEIIGKEYKTVYSTANTNEGFLWSINFFNKKRQNVQQRKENQWIHPPQDFMKLSLPTKSNNYKATAAIVSKAPEDPIFENHAGGAVARTVWMIPDNEVIQKTYEPTFDNDNVTNFDNYEQEFDDEIDNFEDFEPEDIDINEEKIPNPIRKKNKPKRTYIEPEPNYENYNNHYYDEDENNYDDGDFAFETIDEPEQDNGYDTLPAPEDDFESESYADLFNNTSPKRNSNNTRRVNRKG